MKLNKQEQTVVIGLEIVKQHINPKKLEKAVDLYNELNDDMTPKECREAIISVLDKAIDEFIKE
ncbi:hypothetical protein CN390_27730 [Bacillus cereus]|nr:hypothetical protein CN390_27730 [Bacillus cereus]